MLQDDGFGDKNESQVIESAQSANFRVRIRALAGRCRGRTSFDRGDLLPKDLEQGEDNCPNRRADEDPQYARELNPAENTNEHEKRMQFRRPFEDHDSN